MTTTTSEFIIGHSADDAAERKAELRKIAWALLAALVLHLVIGISLAAFSGRLFSSDTPLVEEDEPVEMTMVNLSAPSEEVKPTPAPFIETDESKASKKAPTERTFDSNANSIGASEAAAKGSAQLSSQEGKDHPYLDLDSHDYSLNHEGVAPQPSAPPQETPKAAAIPESTPNESEQLAMLTGTPRPPVTEKTPEPKSEYRDLKQKTQISGAITNRGVSRVNAVGTPLGRYQKLVFDAIGSRWYGNVEDKLDLFGIGTVRMVFRVDRSGHISNLKILENSSNEAFVNFCLFSVQEAHIPAMPDELATTVPSEGLEVEIPFTIFTN